MKYALIENGFIHTADLKKNDAEEMLERYTKCFPDIHFFILTMKQAKGIPYA